MENQRPGHNLAALLVKGRHVLFAIMAVLAVFSALMIPRTRINADVTSNLPDDSQMRKGLTILEKDFPLMDIRMQTLRVMFWNEAPADSLQQAIEAIPGVTQWMGTEQKDSCTLYQFILPRDAKGADVVAAVQARFGDRVIAEVDDNSYMPDNLFLMLGSGVVIALIILFLMCPSFMEGLLMLLALGMAVAINMGSNALLPSVYLVTHTISAVLQLVLSMDFAIILMNRYRQEKGPDWSNEEAMTRALTAAAPSILSSGLTTIASMLMLLFMRLKIGGDMGIVLSKGVFCSLLSTFTVLPALILRFDRAITRTEKPMLKVSTDGLARFEMRFRVPLVILFVAIFLGSWFLQRQTEICYSMNWPTAITKKFPPKNTMLLLYPTADGEAFLPIAERIAEEPGVLSCLDYPTLALKPRTAREWTELAGLMPGLMDSIPDGALDLVYYAATHPERKERMRMDELEPTARALADLAATFLPADAAKDVRARFDIDAMTKQLFTELLPEAEPEPEPEPEPELVPEPEREPELEPEPVVAVDTTVTVPAVADTLQQAELTPGPPPEPAEDLSSNVEELGEWVRFDPADTAFMRAYFTYERITEPRTANEMADFLTMDRKYTALIYRIARAGRKGRPATMSAYEFARVLTDKILTNRLYASMISDEQKLLIRTIRSDFDAVIAAGPMPIASTATVDTLQPIQPLDTTLIVAVSDTLVPAPVPAPVPEPTPEPEPEPEPTPLERLAEMAFSGARYSAGQVYSALRQAGIPVSRDELDLLFLYHGYAMQRDTTTRLSLLQLVDWAEDFAQRPLVQNNVDEATRAQLGDLRAQVDSGLGMLRSEDWSVAVIVSELPTEGAETFAFLDGVQTQCREQLSVEPYYVGYSVMYKEMKEGFPRELLLLTLLTVGAIFLIVALTFRSLVVPFLLIPTVLSAVWLNVYASGLGGNAMLYIAYLIVQSILMGATIDYSILFTQYYRAARIRLDKGEALKEAYRRSFHAILTSGMILVLTPLLMTYLLSDPMVCSILRCISIGALAAILLIFFVLPATLVIMDRWVAKRRKDG